MQLELLKNKFQLPTAIAVLSTGKNPAKHSIAENGFST